MEVSSRSSAGKGGAMIEQPKFGIVGLAVLVVVLVVAR